jgi:hypothetical protein
MVESCVVELCVVDDGGAAGVVRSVDQGQHLTGHARSYKDFFVTLPNLVVN